MSTWLVLLDGPIDEAGVEVLRIAVGALAAGATVHGAMSDQTRAAVEAGDVPEAAEEYLRALSPPETPWPTLGDAPLDDLLRAATHVVRHGRAERSGTPALAVIDDAI